MTRRLISRDSLTGVDTWHEYDSLTDETRIITTSDAEPVLELNKKLQNDDELTKKGIKQGMWLYARIPAGVQVEWMTKFGVDILNKNHGPRMSKLLEDPEYRHLKTTTKHHKIK